MNISKPYNLEERLAVFAEQTIDIVKHIKVTQINKRIISQLVASTGSSGANYCEANEAESTKDFVHKIGIVKKELKESMHWLRLLARANPEKADDVRRDWREAKELLLIFSKIRNSAKRGLEK